jgi:DNA-binding MarR family transcriptional regulator
VEDKLPDPIDRLAELLIRASWRLRRNERKELVPFGLTFGQARALRAISAAAVRTVGGTRVALGTRAPGGAPAVDGMRVGELADRLEIVPRSATTIVEGLESAGLVTRRMDPADRRSVIVACTAEGKELIARLAEERRASAEALFAPLSAEERDELLRLLRSITGER